MTDFFNMNETMPPSGQRENDDKQEQSTIAELATPVIVLILLAMFSAPLGFILYGGAAGAIGGFLIIGVLVAVQLSLFFVITLVPKLGLLAVFLCRTNARQDILNNTESENSHVDDHQLSDSRS